MVQPRHRTPARDQSINIRVSQRQRELIDRAAEVLDVSRSEFMLEAACSEAQHVLLDRVFFQLDADAFERFEVLLSAPAEPSPALTGLMRRKAPWE